MKLHHATPDTRQPVTAVSNTTKRKTVTSKRLQSEERLQRAAETTRKKIAETYVGVDVPTQQTMLQAQQDDPHCQMLMSYLTTAGVEVTSGAVGIKLARWARREARHIRIMEGGLLYRIDPVKYSLDEPSKGSGAPRLFIPEEVRPAYLSAFHEYLGHAGIERMFSLMRTRVYWPGMKADILYHVKRCDECNTAKRLTRNLASPHKADYGSYPFDSVVCDLCSMELTADGRFDHMMVFADTLSRWVEVVPCLGTPTAEEVLDAFTIHVACRYGWPRTFRSDGGSDLAAKLTSEIHRLTGVNRLQGAKYRPQHQGIVERIQGTLIEMCRTANEGGSHWVDYLPFLLFSYHATPHRVTRSSPALLVYGRELRLPAQLDELSGVCSGPLNETNGTAVREYASKLNDRISVAWRAARDASAQVQEHHYSNAYLPHDVTKQFVAGDWVLYRTRDSVSKLHSKWFGPCRILAARGHGRYVLRDLPNNVLNPEFHIGDLRPAPPADDRADDDEYLVDQLLDRRTRRRRLQYLVKWRQYPISQATWLDRSALIDKCQDLIDVYDASNPQPLPKLEPPAGVLPVTTPEPEPTVPVRAAPSTEGLPTQAQLKAGSWQYLRATSRGGTRWFPSHAFSKEELGSPPFQALRDQALDSLPTTVAHLIRMGRGGIVPLAALPPLPMGPAGKISAHSPAEHSAPPATLAPLPKLEAASAPSYAPLPPLTSNTTLAPLPPLVSRSSNSLAPLPPVASIQYNRHNATANRRRRGR